MKYIASIFLMTVCLLKIDAQLIEELQITYGDGSTDTLSFVTGNILEDNYGQIIKKSNQLRTNPQLDIMQLPVGIYLVLILIDHGKIEISTKSIRY